jgi:YidC/Oxa1 family membrane protein insertase
MPTTFNLRIALWAVLAATLYIGYQVWLHDYPPATTVAVAAGSGGSPSGNALEGTVPTAQSSAPAALAGTATAAMTTVPSTGKDSQAAAAAPLVHVHTDVLDLDVSLAGGELVHAVLPLYPINKKQPDQKVELLNRDSPESLFVMQSGLLGIDGSEAPDHRARFTSAVSELDLKPGEDEIQLPLSWSDGHGVTVTKTLTFRRGKYTIGLDYHITNASGAPWSFEPYAQLLRNNPPVQRSYFNVDSYSFKGPAIWNGAKYQKLTLTNKEDRVMDRQVSDGWLAALQHHFVAAIVPPIGVAYRYQLQVEDNRFQLSATGPTQTVAPGTSAASSVQMFVGPKLQTQLTATSPELFRVVDYNHLYILAMPLFKLLNAVYQFTGNWGIAIIVVTFLLKLLFYPLSEASGRSMAKMKALQPRIKQLQETYKDEREKLGTAMMKLYQTEKVNPVAGCLPMLIQMPVFLAFYWALLESVELRQAPFFGWITDLSSRDPLYILPALMAGAMFVQYKINPQMGTDPMQQRLFMIMPLAMSVMFAFFPAGLVLYWVTNTLLSILQQWNINRRIQARALARN